MQLGRPKNLLLFFLLSTHTALAQDANWAFDRLRKQYIAGNIQEQNFWSALEKFEAQKTLLTPDRQLKLMQTQSKILSERGFPVLAALYAQEAIRQSGNAFAVENKSSWAQLAQISKKHSLDAILEDLVAQTFRQVTQPAPVGFGSAWHYYVGTTLVQQARPQDALVAFGQLKDKDRYFLPAKYQEAMIFVAMNDLKRAELPLKMILNTQMQAKSPLPRPQLKALINFAKLGLARIYYEQNNFQTAVRFYRAVDRSSSQYYAALFEQAWAFFMAGYPNHALGALHSATSPFYADVFNPEAAVLASLSYYWLCDYEQSRAALANFLDMHAKTVKSLGDFLGRKKLTPGSAYQLFEDVITGVSEDSLGISRSMLLSASEDDSIMLYRNEYADAIAEINRLEKRGLFKRKAEASALTQRLRTYGNSLKTKIGAAFIEELRDLQREFAGLYEQSEFLYVELLMSEKEQIMGRELHASTKVNDYQSDKKLVMWGKGDQSWRGDQKNEYWRDELGFYIYEVRPKCNKN